MKKVTGIRAAVAEYNRYLGSWEWKCDLIYDEAEGRVFASTIPKNDLPIWRDPDDLYHVYLLDKTKKATMQDVKDVIESGLYKEYPVLSWL